MSKNEVHCKAGEMTIEQGLAQLPNGGVLYLEGEFPNVNDRLRLNNRRYTKENPLIIDGQGKTVMLNKTDVQDSQWITIRNMEFRGGVGLNNSIKDVSLALSHITFENINSRFGQWFAGGYTYSYITLKGCTIQENIYSGNCTHQIYFSGGHWEGSIGLPPPNHIVVDGCTIRYCGGRHGIQVNGRFEDVYIINNHIYCHAFTAFQGIGIERCLVQWNTFFACNRGCLNIYDYDDQFWWAGSNPAYLAWWKQFHHPNRFWAVRNNTMLVGPKSWCNWYDGSQPTNRPAILINNEVNGGVMADGTVIDYQGGPHWIYNNLLISLWKCAVEFDELSSAGVTHIFDNDCIGCDLICFKEDVPIDPHTFTLEQAQTQAPENYSGNKMIGDDVKQWPQFPDASEIPASPNYDWSQWPGTWDLYSKTAAKDKRGVPVEGPTIWTPSGPIRANAAAKKAQQGLMGAVDPDEAMPHYKPTDG